MMKNSFPGSPCTTIFCPSSNCTVSKASATVRRSHLSRDSVQADNVQVNSYVDISLQIQFNLQFVRRIKNNWWTKPLPKMDTLLRNSSYILRFLKVLLWFKNKKNLIRMHMHNENNWQKDFVKFWFIFVIYQKFTTYHQYSPVALSVDTPQLDIGLGFNCSCTRCPVDQCQLPETASLSNAGNPFIVDIYLKKQEGKNLWLTWTHNTHCNILHGDTALVQKTFFCIFFMHTNLTWPVKTCNIYMTARNVLIKTLNMSLVALHYKL